MSDGVPRSGVFSAPENFKIREVDFKRPAVAALAASAKAPAGTVMPAPLGPLTAFTGTWTGRGFNTIFRPNSTRTPTFPPPLNTGDNVLELNLTRETLSFSPSLGSVPNRGVGGQADIFLNGVPYLQTIDDVTDGPANGIHFEPGIWLCVPPTTAPAVGAVTFSRMASIPHGTTITAQGVVLATVPGAPTIVPIDITPFVGGQPNTKVPFPSQTVTNANTPRLPQNLAPFVAAGTITQAMVTDPATVLRDQTRHQTITQTVAIGISTHPATPLPGGPLPAGAAPAPLVPGFAGGTADIAFLDGVPNPPPTAQGPNAQALQMDAVLWIETVQYQVQVPPLLAGTPPVVLHPVPTTPPSLQPSFSAAIPSVPGKSFKGGLVTVAATQIQYAQKVILNFAGLSWPHVSVATLVPSSPVPIPAALLPLT